jgi:hypothetical protein
MIVRALAAGSVIRGMFSLRCRRFPAASESTSNESADKKLLVQVLCLQ